LHGIADAGQPERATISTPPRRNAQAASPTSPYGSSQLSVLRAFENLKRLYGANFPGSIEYNNEAGNIHCSGGIPTKERETLRVTTHSHLVCTDTYAHCTVKSMVTLDV
jgi:hypothetical protein